LKGFSQKVRRARHGEYALGYGGYGAATQTISMAEERSEKPPVFERKTRQIANTRVAKKGPKN